MNIRNNNKCKHKLLFWATFFIIFIIHTHCVAETYIDQESEDFENNMLPSTWVISGLPDGKPQKATLTLTSVYGEYKNGRNSICFQFQRGIEPIPVLAHYVLLKDLQVLSFWIKAEKQTKWAVALKDRDEAVFIALIDLNQGQWHYIRLTPADFFCSEDSPVKKPSLDTTRLTNFYIGFDLYASKGFSGENSIYIDDVTITRASYKLIKGNLLLNGEKRNIDEPTMIQGNLYLINNADLTITASRFIIKGNIGVDNSKLIFKGQSLHLAQDYKYQYFIVAKKGLIEIRDGLLNTNYTIGGAVLEDSTFRLCNVQMLQGSFTFSASAGCTIYIENTDNSGEFLISQGSRFLAQNCQKILLWIRTKEHIESDIVLPKGNEITNWQAPPYLMREITLKQCKDLKWGIIADAQCRLRIRDSSLRVIGINYTGKIKTEVNGLKNKNNYQNLTFNSPQHSLILNNTEVETWNFYTSDSATLIIQNCLFGESISFGTSQIIIKNSTCDGTGGYIGSKDSSTTIFTSGKIECQVITHGNSKFIIQDSSIKGALVATENSYIKLINSILEGQIKEIEQGRVKIDD